MPYNHTSPSSGGKNATSGASAAAAARYKIMARQQKYNQETMKYYAAAVLGLVLIFTIFHWTRFLYSRFASTHVRKSKFMRMQVAIARSIRHVLTHRMPGFTSVGHAVLVVAYLAINIVLTVTNVDWSPNLIGISKRLGWQVWMFDLSATLTPIRMAIVNAAFITFLALKNTPLAYLTAYSYERLNVLHQVGGYTTVIYALLHMILMLYTWIVQMKKKKMLEEMPQIHGMIAVAALFIMMVFATLIRRVRYEVFYISHITGYMLFLINIGLHRPSVGTKTLIITAVAAGIWGGDRVLRGLRILWYSYDNRATITPLPHGGTRIVMRRSPSRSVPGTHCFIWIPKIRAIETHPFTIVQKTPYSLELVISAYDGFTRDLHEYAVKRPGASLHASFDGPYGSLPNFSKIADKIILVAGGSGASFTFGVALDALRKLKDSDRTTIEFIWTVREQDTIIWFQKELTELRSSPRVNVILHTTRPSYANSAPPSPTFHNSPVDEEKRLTLTSTATLKQTSPAIGDHSFMADIEKQPSTRSHAWDSTSSLAAIPGRPDVEKLIKDVVNKASSEERVVIAACGPETLMDTVRRTSARCITVSGPSVELHCEQFGW